MKASGSQGCRGEAQAEASGLGILELAPRDRVFTCQWVGKGWNGGMTTWGRGCLMTCPPPLSS